MEVMAAVVGLVGLVSYLVMQLVATAKQNGILTERNANLDAQLQALRGDVDASRETRDAVEADRADVAGLDVDDLAASVLLPEGPAGDEGSVADAAGAAA